ncbi:MAG: DUF5996 family protein [Ardenticatenaceae bacterium]
MSKIEFSPMPLASWQATYETLALYGKLVGKVRRALTPKQKHWWHISLRAGATGLTTTPIPAGAEADAHTFEMLLDLTNHQLVITNSSGEQSKTPLEGQSIADFCDETLNALAAMGIQPDMERSLFSDTAPRVYDPAAVARYWGVLSQIDLIFKEFKGALRRETSPVQLWPHHFDHAFLWFSGRLVPSYDPENEEYADEQMNFGFVPGDDTYPDPYFYVTAYPAPEGFSQQPLPKDAFWRQEGWTGAIMMYDALVGAQTPKQKLLDYLHAAHQAGSSLMK